MDARTARIEEPDRIGRATSRKRLCWALIVVVAAAAVGRRRRSDVDRALDLRTRSL